MGRPVRSVFSSRRHAGRPLASVASSSSSCCCLTAGLRCRAMLLRGALTVELAGELDGALAGELAGELANVLSEELAEELAGALAGASVRETAASKPGSSHVASSFLSLICSAGKSKSPAAGVGLGSISFVAVAALHGPIFSSPEYSSWQGDAVANLALHLARCAGRWVVARDLRWPLGVQCCAERHVLPAARSTSSFFST